MYVEMLVYQIQMHYYCTIFKYCVFSIEPFMSMTIIVPLPVLICLIRTDNLLI